jgi:hypothetical protein
MKERTISPAFIISFITGPVILLALTVFFTIATMTGGGLGAIATGMWAGGFSIALFFTSLMCYGVYRRRRFSIIVSAVVLPIWILFLTFMLLNVFGIAQSAFGWISLILSVVVSAFLVTVHLRELKM